jgi:hypothetical protein
MKKLKVNEIMNFIKPPIMILNPFDGKYYPDGHVFDDPFAEIRKNINISKSKVETNRKI